MMVREDEKTLQVPSVQALQAVASTVMIIDDQLVLNGYLELEQVAERMRTYSFDDSCGRHDPDACSIASLPALLAISARRSGVMLSARPPALHPVSAAALDRLSRYSSISPVAVLPTMTAEPVASAGRFSPRPLGIAAHRRLDDKLFDWFLHRVDFAASECN